MVNYDINHGQTCLSTFFYVDRTPIAYIIWLLWLFLLEGTEIDSILKLAFDRWEDVFLQFEKSELKFLFVYSKLL